MRVNIFNNILLLTGSKLTNHIDNRYKLIHCRYNATRLRRLKCIKKSEIINLRVGDSDSVTMAFEYLKIFFFGINYSLREASTSFFIFKLLCG